MWEALADQLTCTREHAIGSPLPDGDEAVCDESLIAHLFIEASKLGVSELDRHVEVGSYRLCASGRPGRDAFACLARKLIARGGDGAVTGLRMFLRVANDARVAEKFSRVVVSLAADPDYLISLLAERLARGWGVGVVATKAPLPTFYSLEFQGGRWADFREPSASDAFSGAMRVEEPEGWTAGLEWLVRSLARDKATVERIRRRVASLIARWGGLELFGQSETRRLESRLASLDMRLPWVKPHMAVALRALRHVAGEMRRAGLVGTEDEAWLLHAFGCSPCGMPVPVPSVRPRAWARPRLAIDWNNRSTAWLDGADRDDSSDHEHARRIHVEADQLATRSGNVRRQARGLDTGPAEIKLVGRARAY